MVEALKSLPSTLPSYTVLSQELFFSQMDKTILESVLKKNWKDKAPEKILSIDEAPALGKNLNFLSTVNRLSLKVVLANGRVAKKSFIVKVQNSNGVYSDMNNRYNTFQTEIKMYEKLSQLEYLMEEFDDTEDVLWCKMIHHFPEDDSSSIILEDLKAEGFLLIERQMLYDLDHTLLAAHSLGRYHGMSKALEERGIHSPQGLKTWYLFENEQIQVSMYRDFMAMVRSVKRLWDPSWTPIVDKINITKEELQERFTKLSEVEETKFNVINHGDCHKNNILFKYNWDKRPISLRFVDFQMLHYGSPCIDLTYMLYLAVQPSVRRKNFDLILRTYHEALVKTLDKYQFNGNKPSLDEIKEGMERYSFMGLTQAIAWCANILKSDKVLELRDQTKIDATDGLEGYSDEIYEGLGVLGPDIKDFVKRFC